MKDKIYKIVFFLTLGVVEYLATTTAHIPIVEHIWDKANHFSAFFVLYILLSLAYPNFKTLAKIVILLAFGIQIEIVQGFIAGRSSSLLDIVADSVGILLGFLGDRYGVTKFIRGVFS